MAPALSHEPSTLVADDGSGKLDLGPGESGEVSFNLEIQSIDVYGFFQVGAFLDDEDNQDDGELDVVDLMQGFEEPADDLVYVRDFTLPADISHDDNNEYGLLMARTDGVFWGPGSYTVDTLVIMNHSDEVGEHPITFEKGDRAPAIYNSSFLGLYPWGFGLAGVFPHFADPGVGGADNPFMINTIPEPTTLAVVALGGFALLRRRA